MNVESSSLSFAYPLLLVAGLLASAAMLWLARRFEKRREEDMSKLVHQRFRQKVFAGFSPAMRRVKRRLWVLAVFFLFVAMARPQWGVEFREVSRRGIDLLFALDTSQSMLAEDLTPNRLDRARLGIMDFVDRLEGDRIGLIPFAGSAYALCPLTLDYAAFRESLQVVSTNMIPHQGTDIASAIDEAERLFNEAKNNQRILVLITDGEDLQGDVIERAKAASKNGMVIYTVGVGSPEGTTIPVRYRNGQTDLMRDEKGEVVRTSLDESTLKKIAETAKGIYTPLGRGAEGLDKIYQEKLRLVPKTELNQRMQKIPLERYQWPLAIALLLFLVEFFLPDRKRDPVAVRSITVVSVLTLCLWGALSQSSQAATDCRELYNQGTSAYQKGDFSQAEESLQASLRTSDLSLQQQAYYNLGNAQFRAGQAAQQKDPKETIKRWKESLKSYEAALSLNRDDADARFNKEVVEKKLKQLEQQQPQEQKSDQQKKEEEEKKEQEKKEQEQKEQQKQDEQQKQEQKDQQKQDGQEGKEDQQKKEQEAKDQEAKEQQEKEAKEGKEGEEKKDQQQGQPQDKKEGEQGKESEAQQAQRMEKREMTKEEAMQLLESLRNDEQRVIPVPMQKRDGKTDNTTKGKTW